MASIDLKDGYFHILIAKEHRKFLRFEFNELLESLGFIVNKEKSCLTPSKTCEYLGFIWNSNNLTVKLPDRKKEKILKLTQDFRKKSKCSIRAFAQCIGVLVAACPGVRYGWLYTKQMERAKFLALEIANGNFEASVHLSSKVKSEIDWWISKISGSFNLIRDSKFQLEIFSDASLTGWGACCGAQKTHGWWDVEDRNQSINYLELKAAFYSLKSLASDHSSCQILMRIDNTTAISYINRMGGVQFSNLQDITKQIWQWCEKRDIWIFASYIKSKDNVVADKESRVLPPETEWELNHSEFRKIVDKFGVFEIDLFATCSNNKCPKFVSWFPDPESVAIDAMTIPWGNTYFYAFPPFSLILRVIKKIIEDRAEGVLVVPFWPTQENSPDGRESYPGGREIMRQAFSRRGIPESGLDIMLASLSENTIKQYEKPLRLWWEYCFKNKLSVFNVDSKEVLQFFSEVFKDVGSYGTLNSYRAAVSLILSIDIGKDPLIKRFFKGVANLKPQRARYDFIWDPQIVIDFLKTQFPHDQLKLEDLTKKLLMLIALVTAHRMQTFAKISIDNIIVSSEFIQIKVPERVKTSKINKLQPCLVLPFFKEQPELCVASILQMYIKKTKDLRGSNKNLFITCRKPFKPATTQTLARWIRSTLEKSGVDVSIFKSHSTRHASTSAANLRGIDLETIRKTAGWSENSSVFATFYKRPISDKAAYARALIQS
ncbi:uncharacterized protein LOC122512807 [Leptopilina heterotoma]|uniref:uncharacterized protein LOC122512807 n=1 Tax=Leptopilina heterotoma TaxID=63436 RepID=UPI001CA7C82B|nr:uncharacterized protein LOC122512807 [Leptopilina heterotoma]